MVIFSIGYNYQHQGEFIRDYSNGLGCHLMLLVKEPSVFHINGERYDVAKNSFLLIAPGTPCKYYPKGDVYTDDWVFFNLEEGDEENFRELNIPCNEVLHLGHIDELSQLIRSIAYEHYSTGEHHDKIQQHYFEIFLLKLNAMLQTSTPHSYVLADKNNRFIQLRNTIYGAPETLPDVDTLAKNMNMSRSGFQHAYKRIFGINIMTDIVDARMACAKQLLISTNLSIREIAKKCGYSNEYGFMRRFKSYYGQTPTQFRSIL